MAGDIEYEIRGFLTVRRDSLRVPLRGSLTVRVVPGSGHFTGDLVLRPAAVGRRVLGVSLFGATVRIDAESPVTGRIDERGQMSATVTIDADHDLPLTRSADYARLTRLGVDTVAATAFAGAPSFTPATGPPDRTA